MKADKRPKINTAWHKIHPMPKNPSLHQRIDWHLDHYKNCGCREIPDKLKDEIKHLKIKIPAV